MPANYTRNKCSRGTRCRCLLSRHEIALRSTEKRGKPGTGDIRLRFVECLFVSDSFVLLRISNDLPSSPQAMGYLNEHNVMHRDIRGNNILLTKEGDIKLVDFGLSKMYQGEMGKRYTCIGSPSWMAPEVAMSKGNSSEGYGSRADVWAIGITAIELADGKPPFQDMHPTRALFQIVRNPPPNLTKPSIWSQNFNDFIAEYVQTLVISCYKRCTYFLRRQRPMISFNVVPDVSRKIPRTGRLWRK